MDPKELAEILNKTLGEALPEVVDSVVEEKVKAFREDIQKSNDEVRKQLSEISASAKFASAGDDTAARKAKAKGIVVRSISKIISQSVTSEETAEKIFDAEMKAAFMNESTAEEGKEFVFDEFSKDVLAYMKEYPLIDAVGMINIKGTSITLPTWENLVGAFWTDEGASITKSKGKTGKVKYDVHKLASLVTVTEEMLEDNMTTEDLYDLIVRSIANSQVAKIENGIINGETGKMEGILANADVAVVALVAGNTTLRDADVADVDDGIIDLDVAISSEFEGNPNNASAIMSKYTLAQLKKKRTSSGFYVYPELRETNPRLGKYSVIVSSKMPVQSFAQDVAGSKHVIVGNVKEFYRVVRRKELSVVRGYADGDFQGDLQSIKGTQRVTGGLITGKAFAVLATSNA